MTLKAALHRLRWRLFYALAAKRVVHGIEVICDVHAPGVDEASVFARMDEALGLIERYQPWRLNQLRRHLKRIIIRRRVSNRAALTAPTTAELDWTFVMNHAPAEVAASIIHEGVHARLRRSIGPSTEARRPREERICRRAEASFGGAIPGGQPVRERALAAIDGGERALAPAVDWREMERRNAEAYWAEVGIPGWLRRIRMPRR